MRLHLGIAAPNAISPDEALKRVMDGNARYSSNMPAIEYGVRFLGVPLVMVLGHSGCGAVDAGGAPHGERARMLFDPAKMFRSPPRASIGEVSSFLSGLYFRGKLAQRTGSYPTASDALAGTSILTRGAPSGFRHLGEGLGGHPVNGPRNRHRAALISWRVLNNATSPVNRTSVG
jgi:hypothetical protein